MFKGCCACSNVHIYWPWPYQLPVEVYCVWKEKHIVKRYPKMWRCCTEIGSQPQVCLFRGSRARLSACLGNVKSGKLFRKSLVTLPPFMNYGYVRSASTSGSGFFSPWHCFFSLYRQHLTLGIKFGIIWKVNTFWKRRKFYLQGSPESLKAKVRWAWNAISITTKINNNLSYSHL